ncbi:MAG: DUF1573 domain-containing protein [bacterium]|nr:DUF1573 domain-containing protein [bacterium]
MTIPAVCIRSAVMAVALLALGLPRTSLAAPRIYCAAPIQVFRAEGSTPYAEHTFFIENRGDKPLEITRILACCRTGTDMLRLIPPGSNSQLYVKTPLTERTGLFTKNVTLECNDPLQPYLYLCLSGMVYRYVDVEPRSVDFGRCAGDRALVTNVSVIFESKFKLAVTNILTTSPAFTAIATPVDENGARITIRTVPPLAEGVYQGEIWLATDNAVFPYLRVGASVSVLREYVTVPEVLTVAPTNATITRTVLIRPRHHRPVKVLSVTCANPAITAQCTPTGELGFRCDVTFRGVTAALHGAQIIVTTDDASQRDIVIPVTVGAQTAEL